MVQRGDSQGRRVWYCAGRKIVFDRPLVMGILNVTPDSFTADGLWCSGDHERAVAHGVALAEAGADIIDVGGESTRPGAVAVSAVAEIERVVPVVEALAGRLSVPISVDTSKAAVAEAALAAGAVIINDITALNRVEMVEVAAATGAGVVLMHMRGTPQTMNTLAVYEDVVGEVYRFLDEAVERVVANGVAAESVVIDPGFGFAKNVEQNGELLRELGRFREIAPVLAGLSRKRCIGAWSGVEEPSQRIAGSVAAALLAVQRGAAVVRVHDVRETVEGLKVQRAVESNNRDKLGI